MLQARLAVGIFLVSLVASKLVLAVDRNHTVAKLLTNSTVQTALESEPRLPNIEYLGFGYNIILGQPDYQGIDPGFTNGIFDLMSFTQNRTTSDYKFSIPDNTVVLANNVCTMSSTVSRIMGQSSQQDTYKKSVSVSGGYGPFSATAFVGSSGMEESKSLTESAYMSTTASCLVYNAKLDTIEPELSTSFVKDISNLPSESGLLRLKFGVQDLCVYQGNLFTQKNWKGASVAVGFCDLVTTTIIPSTRGQWRFTDDGLIINAASGYCLEVNPGVNMLPGGHYIDLWDCDQASYYGDKRTNWEINNGVITSLYTKASKSPTLEINPYTLASLADVWECDGANSLKDGRTVWDLGTNGHLVPQYGSKGYCFVAKSNTNQTYTELKYCDSIDAADANAVWSFQEGHLVNKGTGNCLTVDTHTPYPPGGNSVMLVQCASAQIWNMSPDGHITTNNGTMCLEHNPWGQYGTADAWEIPVFPDQRNVFSESPAAPKTWESAYFDVLNTYGSHFVTGIQMGARMSIYDEVSYQSYQNLTSKGTSIFASAQLKFQVATVGTEGMSNDEKRAEEAYSSQVSKSNVFFVGSTMLTPGSDLSTWQKEIQLNPLPMKVELKLLYEVLSPAKLPNLSSQKVSNIASRMQEATLKLCDQTPGCTAAMVDPNSDLTPCPIDESGNVCSNHGVCMPTGECDCRSQPGTQPDWSDPSKCSVDCSPVEFQDPTIDGYSVDRTYDASTYCKNLGYDSANTSVVSLSVDSSVRSDGSICKPWNCGFLWLDTCYCDAYSFISCNRGKKQMCG